MADETDYPKRGYDTKDVEAMREKQPGKRRRHWGKIALLSIIVVPAVLFGLWAWITLSYTYSKGDRAGYLQKFSEKGWLCKTWEGELTLANVPGAMPEIFHFSVRDDRVAADLMRAMGNRVSITYEEHKGVPTSCFGDTDYFVTNVRAIDAPTTPPPTTPPVPPVVPPANPPAPPASPPPADLLESAANRGTSHHVASCVTATTSSRLLLPTAGRIYLAPVSDPVICGWAPGPARGITLVPRILFCQGTARSAPSTNYSSRSRACVRLAK